MAWLKLIEAIILGPSFAFEIWMVLFHSEKRGTGKRIMRRVRLVFARKVVKSLARGEIPSSYLLWGASSPADARLASFLPLALVSLALIVSAWITGNHYASKTSVIVYWTLVIVVNLDDYFTDNDKWKRFWTTAKNKVRWKWVPARVPVPT